MRENEFKKWFRQQWKGLVDSYEPRKGGSVGVADLQVVFQERLIPVELKMGKIVGDKLIVDKIRPAQIQWHEKIGCWNVLTVFLVAVGDYPAKEPQKIFVFKGLQVRTFLKPILFKNVEQLPVYDFNMSFRKWLNLTLF